jgi:Uma2 family endonuclease
MATVLGTPEQKVILNGVSWQTYERLLAEHAGSSGTRFSYDRGALEIRILSAKHEAIKHTLALLVEVVAEGLGVDVYGLGSTTFRREDLGRGFEPDACFYVQREALVRGKDEIDLRSDPPPDLVIETSITHPSLKKFPIFSALGVPEVWRYEGERAAIFSLGSGEYVEVDQSAALAGVTGEALSGLIAASQELKRTEWLRRLREWVRTQSNSLS